MTVWENDELSTQELEELIRERPLTQKSIESILQNNINQIKLCDVGGSCTIPFGEERYIILITSQVKTGEQEIHLIREISHIHYKIRAGPYKKSAKMIDKMLQAETERFYFENKDFAKQIYSDIFE